ncbi:transposase [Streptomyces hygroscopicus subsp. hygroscopicus]|nr:transposase [Streptomyces hygroscopicus subsp. hygroscopicus]
MGPAALCRARFAKGQCQRCPDRPRCTSSRESARNVGLPPRELRDLQTRVRAEQLRSDWKACYAVRSGVEEGRYQRVRNIERLSGPAVTEETPCRRSVRTSTAQVPPVFGPSGATAHRRFMEWSQARVWAKLHRLVLDELGSRGELDWSRCAIDSVNMRALTRRRGSRRRGGRTRPGR